jgi:hypothetical protein
METAMTRIFTAALALAFACFPAMAASESAYVGPDGLRIMAVALGAAALALYGVAIVGGIVASRGR